MEFRNIRSQLIKAYSKWICSGQDDKDDDEQDGDSDDKYNVFVANFLDFCKGDMKLFYMYCVFSK